MEGTDGANIVTTTGLRRLFHILRLAALPLAVGGAAWFAWSAGYFDLEHRRRLVRVVADFHSMPFAFPAFVVFWAVVVALALPAAIASTLGGAIFGTGIGIAANWLGAMLATVLAHTLARRTVRASIMRIFGEHRLMRVLRDRGDTMMLLRLRLMPLAPFAALDYVAGIVGVPLRRLLAATTVGFLPTVVAYSYLGAQLMSHARSADGLPRGALWIAIGASALMLLLSIVPSLWRHVRE